MDIFDLVILGGGLPGLIGALIAKQSCPDLSVLLLEGSPACGGNLRGVHAFGDHFERGTHILQETGDREIDDLLLTSVDKNTLIALDSSVGDFVATIRNGQVHDSVAYPAVRDSDEPIARKILAEVLALLENQSDEVPRISQFRDKDLRRATHLWFGEAAFEHVIAPILEVRFGGLENLSGFALEVANLSRLKLVDYDEWVHLSSIPGFVDRVAFPDQKALPEERRHGRRSLYSSANGSLDFVDGVTRRCQEAGVLILTGAAVQTISSESAIINYVQTGREKQVKYRKLVSCLGPTSTRNLFDSRSSSIIQRTPLSLVHLSLRDPLGSLVCYFYDQDEDSHIFRLTNYGAFSGRELDTRMTVEVSNLVGLTSKEMINYVIESKSFRAVCGPDTVISNAISEETHGFPLPSISTFARFREDDAYFKANEFGDIRVCGAGTRGSLFFQTEIVHDLVRVVREVL